MENAISKFARDTSGAITSDWVIMLAGVVMMVFGAAGVASVSEPNAASGAAVEAQ